MSNGNFMKDLNASLEIVWMISSLIIAAVLFLAYFFPETLCSLSPVCISKSLYGEECFMCGMTRAFVFISGGNFIKASELNSLSIYLFSVFAINTIVFIICLYIKLKFFINKKSPVGIIPGKFI